MGVCVCVCVCSLNGGVLARRGVFARALTSLSHGARKSQDSACQRAPRLLHLNKAGLEPPQNPPIRAPSPRCFATRAGGRVHRHRSGIWI